MPIKNLKLLHPFLFALFPVLALYVHNEDILTKASLKWPIFLVFLFCFLLYAAFFLIFRNLEKAALANSIFLFLFFVFGPTVNLLFGTGKQFLLIGSYRLSDPGYWLVLFVFGFAFSLILKNLKSTPVLKPDLALFFFRFALILVSLTLLNFSLIHDDKKFPLPAPAQAAPMSNEQPDIYYLIFDSYGRQDALSQNFNFDNSRFIAELRNLGFYVADESLSNYSQTYLSMSSALNLDYISTISDELDPDSDKRNFLREAIKNSRVFARLKESGYGIVEMPPMWGGLFDNLPSDIRYENGNDFDSFSNVLLSATPLHKFFNARILCGRLRERVLFNFENIPSVASLPQPTMLYAHFLPPHPPFLFDGKGQAITPDYSEKNLENPTPEDYAERYPDEIRYLNQEITAMIKKILVQSEKPPIIILQADHGSGMEMLDEDPEKTNMFERFSILNAYYVPAEIKNQLYDSISPVNTFRLVFNHLFHDDWPLLPDKSFFARWSRPYDFIEVTERAQTKE